MHSSTSASEARAPDGSWGRTWLVALALGIATLASAELLWRSQEFTPSVPDTPQTWAVERSRVRPDSFVLVGTSRMQAAIDPAVWAESWDGRWPVQLSIAGGSPLPVLEDLAADVRYRGRVAVDVVPEIVFGSEAAMEEARAHVEAYARLSASPAAMIEARIRVALAGALVVLRMSPLEFADRAFVRETRGRILYFSMTPRRFLRLDFALADLPRRIEATLRELDERGHDPGEAETARIVERFAAAHAAIRSRGGDVVLVHLPLDGKLRERTREKRLRERYWDRLVGATGASAIHFEDQAALAHFRCPDGSHLDVSDTAGFTRALVRAIRKREQRGIARRSPRGA